VSWDNLRNLVVECPQNIRESIRAYVRGRPTGGFLEAVLQNDLMEAVLRADDTNRECLPAILAFVYNNVPSPMWGSPKAVDDHLLACREARK